MYLNLLSNHINSCLLCLANIRQSIVCFCTLKSFSDPEQKLVDIHQVAQALKTQVRSVIGPFATPKRIIIVPDLPKTRSGKIMRRILRKIALGDLKLADAHNSVALSSVLGDTSTLADPLVVSILVECFYSVGE